MKLAWMQAARIGTAATHASHAKPGTGNPAMGGRTRQSHVVTAPTRAIAAVSQARRIVASRQAESIMMFPAEMTMNKPKPAISFGKNAAIGAPARSAWAVARETSDAWHHAQDRRPALPGLPQRQHGVVSGSLAG